MKTITKTILIASVLLSGVAGAAYAKGGKGLMRAADTNNDNKISAEEFNVQFKKRFAQIDADADGIITNDELSAFSQENTDERKSQRHVSRVKALDANWDGQLTTAELDSAAQTMFERLDSDDDGFITREDRRSKRDGKRGRKHRN